MMGKKLAVACGGTGGHIFPGLATAKELSARGHEVTLWLSGRDVEALSVGDWPGETVKVAASGFSGGLSLRAVRTAAGLARAALTCRREMYRRRPDALLAMGSYASVGPVVGARACGVPVVLHEANAVPGRAVSVLSRMARCVALSFPEAARFFRVPTTVTGMPLRGDLTGGQAIDMPGDGMIVLVMGGSQGAHVLNEVACEAICRVGPSLGLQVLHLAGTRDADQVRARYEAAGVTHRVFGFLSDMPAAYARTGLAISRSGASSCLELAACGVPALLVPLPSAMRDHQAANAESMKAAGGMDILPQSALTVDSLAEYLQCCVREPQRLAGMREALARGSHGGATARLADVVEGVAAGSLSE